MKSSTPSRTAIVFLCLLAGSVTLVQGTCYSDDWDFFVLEELSPGGDCYVYRNCSLPQEAPSWTMHGLWPTKNNSAQCPYYCNQSATFDLRALKDQLPSLRKNWPNLLPPKALDKNCQNESTYIWCHEWLKHGTCATGIPSLRTEALYFKTTLELFEEKMNYDTHVLAKCNITPSKYKEYELDDFVTAFEKMWNVKPVMTCKYYNSKQVLISIKTCLNKDFSLTRCPSDVFDDHSCSSRDSILYLPPAA